MECLGKNAPSDVVELMLFRKKLGVSLREANEYVIAIVRGRNRRITKFAGIV